jgi:hypothetical protein
LGSATRTKIGIGDVSAATAQCSGRIGHDPHRRDHRDLDCDGSHRYCRTTSRTHSVLSSAPASNPPRWTAETRNASLTNEGQRASERVASNAGSRRAAWLWTRTLTAPRCAPALRCARCRYTREHPGPVVRPRSMLRALRRDAGRGHGLPGQRAGGRRW